jgi:hypothetical protein
MGYFKLKMFGEILEECSEPNWDGYGAEPVSPISVIRAAHFCALLPKGIPQPDVVPETDGMATLEWNTKLGDLSISFTDGEDIHFAGMYAKERPFSGTAQFTTKIPAEILTLTERICKSQPTS